MVRTLRIFPDVLGCLLAGCLNFSLLSFYGLYKVVAKSETGGMVPEDS